MTSFVLIDRTSKTKTNRIWGSLRSSNHRGVFTYIQLSARCVFSDQIFRRSFRRHVRSETRYIYIYSEKILNGSLDHKKSDIELVEALHETEIITSDEMQKSASTSTSPLNAVRPPLSTTP